MNSGHGVYCDETACIDFGLAIADCDVVVLQGDGLKKMGNRKL